MQKQDPRTEKVPLQIKSFFGLSSLDSLTISRADASLLTIINLGVLVHSARWIGIALVVNAVWNAISGPIFGFLSDRTHSRLSRRVGAFFGMNALVTQPAQSLVIFLTAQVLKIRSFFTRD